MYSEVCKFHSAAKRYTLQLPEPVTVCDQENKDNGNEKYKRLQRGRGCAEKQGANIKVEQQRETEVCKEEWGIGAGGQGVGVDDEKGVRTSIMRKFLGKQKPNVRSLSA